MEQEWTWETRPLYNDNTEMLLINMDVDGCRGTAPWRERGALHDFRVSTFRGSTVFLIIPDQNTLTTELSVMSTITTSQYNTIEL